MKAVLRLRAKAVQYWMQKHEEYILNSESADLHQAAHLHIVTYIQNSIPEHFCYLSHYH